MAFTVDDFQDLLRLLEQRPEWRAELRRHILPDELLELPAVIRQLAKAQSRTDQQLAILTTRVEQLAARVDQLAVHLEQLAARVDQLAARIDRLADTQEALAERFDQHERRNAIDFQIIKNDQLTRRLADRPGLFREVIDNPRALTPAEADRWLNELVDREQLNRAEYRQLLWADLLVRGEREGQTGYLVVEVSWTVGLRDVDRAQRRASLLRRIGIPTWPAVVGHRVSDRARDRLQQEPVVHVIPGPDGDEVEIDEPE